MELQHNHQDELFFLENFNLDRVFDTINRADYTILYYIKDAQEKYPGQRVYLAQLAQSVGLTIPQLSRMVEKMQDNGLVFWKTDSEAGRTYVELTSKAVELMAEERAWIRKCYAQLEEEIGSEELLHLRATLRRMAEILAQSRRERGGEGEE